MLSLPTRIACAAAALWLRDVMLLPILLIFAMQLARAPMRIVRRADGDDRFIRTIAEWFVLGTMILMLSIAGFYLPTQLDPADVMAWCDKFRQVEGFWPWPMSSDRAFITLYQAGIFDRAFVVFFIFNTMPLTTIFFLLARLPILVQLSNFGIVSPSYIAPSHDPAMQGLRGRNNKPLFIGIAVVVVALLLYVTYFHIIGSGQYGMFTNYVRGGGAYILSRTILSFWVLMMLTFITTGLMVVIYRKPPAFQPAANGAG